MTHFERAGCAAGRVLQTRHRVATTLGALILTIGMTGGSASEEFSHEPGAIAGPIVMAEAPIVSAVFADPRYWGLQLKDEASADLPGTNDGPDPERWRLGLGGGQQTGSDEIQPVEDIAYDAAPAEWKRPLKDAVHRVEDDLED